MSLNQLIECITPIAQKLKSIDLSNPQAAQGKISQIFPLDLPEIQQAKNLMLKGRKEGWLLPKENGGIRFGRVTKDLCGFSVDAVLMSSPGPRHRHGNGEIDLCFSTEGKPKFDNQPEGWVVYGPNSVHTPTVSGGEMLILYFLPQGAIEFL